MMMDLEAWGPRSERWALRALAAGVAFLGLLCVAAVFLVTLGFDEAWILEGLRQILEPETPDAAVVPVLTSGGLFAFGQLVILALFGPSLWVQRLFPLLCTAACVWIVSRWAAERSGGRRAGLLCAAVFLSTPGLVVLGSSAFACMPAFLLILLTAEASVAPGRSTWRVVGVGVAAGLAIATRLNAFPVLPALVLAATLVAPGERRRRLTEAVAACGLAVVTAAGSYVALSALGPAALADHQTVASGGGLQGLLNYPRLLNKWAISESFLPLSWLCLAVFAGVFLARREVRAGRPLPAFALLVPFAVIAWLFWVLRAPINHLRYLLPALAGFGALMGLAVAALYEAGARREKLAPRLLALTIALGFVVGSAGTATRDLVFGNGNVLSWEWAGQAPQSYFTRFRHVLYQRQAAAFLAANTEPDERVVAVGGARAIGYLARRPVLQIRDLVARDLWHPERLPRRLIVTPIVGHFLFLTGEGRHWLTENARLEAEFGGLYAFYEVTGSLPDDPTLLQGTLRPHPGLPHVTRAEAP